MNRHFTKKDTQTANKHMKRCPTSLAIREIHIKNTMKCSYTPIRVAKIRGLKQLNIWSVSKYVGQMQHSPLGGIMYNSVTNLKNNLTVS